MRTAEEKLFQQNKGFYRLYSVVTMMIIIRPPERGAG